MSLLRLSHLWMFHSVIQRCTDGLWSVFERCCCAHVWWCLWTQPSLGCRVQRCLWKRSRLSKPRTCSLPVGTLYNSLLLKFLRKKKINVVGLKGTCLVGFYSSQMSLFFPHSIHIPSFHCLLQTSSTHLDLKHTLSQARFHDCAISQRESLRAAKDIWQLSSLSAGECR